MLAKPEPVASSVEADYMSSLPRRTWDMLAELANEERHLPAGALLFRAGDASEAAVYCVAEGSIHIGVTTPGGHDIDLGHFGAHTIFGELSLLDGLPRAATATAVQPTKLLVVPGELFFGAIAKGGEVMRGVYRYLCTHVRLADRLLIERRMMEAELHRLATTDALTGVANRRLFMEQAEAERRRSQRHKRHLAVIAFDIDRFKSVNDTYGHAVGDTTLKLFANVIDGMLRVEDVFGRIGGEEFAAFLPETPLAGALVVAERLRIAVSEARVPLAEGELAFTVSIGVTMLDTADPSFDAALARADEALYAAKHGGRNRVSVAPAPVREAT